MSQLNAESRTLEALAEEFVARYRRGERPTLSEYINAHPELADDIREPFPPLVMMEELAPSDSGASVTPTAAAAQQPHLSLGDYRLIRELGRGGMEVLPVALGFTADALPDDRRQNRLKDSPNLVRNIVYESSQFHRWNLREFQLNIGVSQLPTRSFVR